MKTWKCAFFYLLIVSLELASAAPSSAQSLTGTLRGVVLDQQSKVVPDASIAATSENTGTSVKTTSSSAGTYSIPNLPSGTYKIKVEANGFASYLRTGIQVLSSHVTEVSVNLDIASATATVLVESGANLVQTETSQISGSFEGNSISDIPVQSGAFLSVLNLAIFLPNTTTQIGGTSGTGGSIGGLRGRQNSFSIDGTDNNNRAYDAFSNQEGQIGKKRRYDFNRVGGDVGGSIIKNKLFYYGAYEFNNLGLQPSAPAPLAPTSAGMTQLNAMAVDQQVSDLLAQFPIAAAQTNCGNPSVPCTVTVNTTGAPVLIPVGTVQAVAPSYVNQQDYIINGDYNLGQQSLHGRYLKSRTRQPSFGGSFPLAQFASFSAADSRRVILNHTWTATSHLVNDFRGSFVRYTQFFPLSGIAQNFPTLTIDDLDGITLGPNGNLPQHRVFDEYTLGDTVSFTHGRHTLKWGGQYYWYISPSEFLQNQRGQYGYTSLNQLINDQLPSKPNFTLQGLGSGFFSGNAKNFSFFMQDDVKVTSRLTLNLGLRYDFFGNPAGTKANALNAVASLPGTPLVFRVPKQDWNNIGPRIGFAWDPTGKGKWAVRGGGGMAYDVIPWNFYTNANPVQLQVVLTPGAACLGTFGAPPAWCSTANGSGFLADGGMHNIVFAPPATQAAARAQTSNIMADAAAPKVFTWSLSVQREIMKNTSLEVRYLGTRALELPVQVQLTSITPFEQDDQ